MDRGDTQRAIAVYRDIAVSWISVDVGCSVSFGFTFLICYSL